MTPAQRLLLSRLERAWAVTPTLTFGQLIESVENGAWDMVDRRWTSARMLHMPDDLFSAALDRWVNVPVLRKAVVP